MKRRAYGPWALAALNVLLLALVGCAGDSATNSGESDAVDPQSIVNTAGKSDLTDSERDLLARAKGREWEELSPEELKAYLAPRADSTTAVFFWQPNSGYQALQEVQEAVRGLDTLGIRTAVAVYDGGDERAELVALRESKIVLPAFRLSRAAAYNFIDRGMPSVNTLVASPAGGDKVTPFSNKTPIQAFKPLLTAMAPK